MGKKKYIPSPAFNPVIFNKKLEKLEKEVDMHMKSLDAISKYHDIQIAQLGNFARHDIKNAILSMDSILTSTEVSEFNDEKKDSLMIYLEIIRKTIDNFAMLVPYTSDGTFKIYELMIAVEILTRADMQNNIISLNLNYDKNDETEVEIPFQMLVQMVNNLIINSIKALSEIGFDFEKIICISTVIENDILKIKVVDNGVLIPNDIVDKIFEYGFSTCNGSGIGLFHAKILCERHGGLITLDNNLSSNMTKEFCITLPIKRNERNNFNN